MADDKKSDSRGKPDSGSSREKTILEGFEKYTGINPKILLSPAVQPFLRKRAEWLGKKLRKHIPVDSPLRSDIAEFIVYVAAAKVESLGTAESPVLRAIGEFMAAFGQTFCGGEDEDDARPEKASRILSPQYAKMFAETDEAWLKRVFELAVTTPADAMPAVKEQVMAEGDLLWTAINLALYGPKKEPEPEEPGVPLKERFEAAVKAVNDGLGKFNTEVESGVRRLKKDTERRRQERMAAEAKRTQAPFKERALNVLGWILWK